MNKTIIALFVVLFSSILFLSCRKTKQDSQQSTATLPQLLSATFTYDTSTYVTQESFSYKQDGTLASITDESWDATTPENKKVIGTLQAIAQPNALPYTIQAAMENGTLAHKIQYLSMPGHQLVKQRSYESSQTTYEEWLGLDEKNRITADTLIDANTHQISSYTLFMYDANDNAIQTDVYSVNSSGTFVHATTNIYTYDQNSNPFYNIKYASGNSVLASFYTYFSKNNMLTHTNINHLSGYSGILREYSYEYNSLGLPVKRYSSSNRYTVTFEYQSGTGG
jgi:hypothetical protein